MSLSAGGGLSTLHTQSQSVASHHTETCNVVIFGETGAGKSSLINLVAGKQTALTSCDSMGCTTETNAYDVSIQNKTLNVKLIDTVGLGEGPEGAVPDKEARGILKKLLRDLMKKTDIHLLMYCVRGVRATKALCRNYDLIRSEVKERVPIVLVATALEDQAPEMEEWWRKNVQLISDFGMAFAGHACVTTATIDQDAEDSLKRRHKQSYRAVCQLIEQCRLPEEVQTPLLDVGRWLHNAIQQVSTMTARKRHKDIVLTGETAASVGSPVDLMAAEEVAHTAPDLRRCTLQYTEPIGLYDEIFEAFETIRLEDPHLGIREDHIPPDVCASNDDQNIVLAGEIAASVGSLVNLMAGDEVAPTAPDMRCRMLECSETVDSDDETFEGFEAIRVENHLEIKEHPITLDTNARNNDEDIVLTGERAACNGSLVNLMAGDEMAPTTPVMRSRVRNHSTRGPYSS
ncbi:P-loop containing nucleoside triphosphate hydrolase protein [Suillus lakei]|nr:P-loop containing nucleoside triphosphate hydrolase protein [Suillus lakei]